MNVSTQLLLAVGLALFASADTNKFYVTDTAQTHYGGKVTITQEQIERAKHAPESRPAERDPEGHWGLVSEGFQLSLRFGKASFTNAEPIWARVIIRNVTDQQLSFPIAFASDDTSDTRFVVTSGDERIYARNEPKPGASFAERLKWLRCGSSAACPSAPGTQREFLIDLRQWFDLTNGQYTVCAKREVLTLESRMSTNVISGKVSFTIVSAATSDR